MKIQVLASSSAANCYLISSAHSHIILEAGLPIPTVATRLLPLSLVDVVAVFVSHAHGDHSRAAKDFADMGKPIIASKETLQALQIDRGIRLTPWEKTVPIGGFRITGFPLDHDCDGAMGIILEDIETGELLLFANDTRTVKWDLTAYPFSRVMVECNHNKDILTARGDPGMIRKASSHMELQTTKAVVSRLNLSKCRGIWLMHLSDGNSNQEIMRREIAGVAGIPVWICKKDGGIC